MFESEEIQLTDNVLLECEEDGRTYTCLRI